MHSMDVSSQLTVDNQRLITAQCYLKYFLFQIVPRFLIMQIAVFLNVNIKLLFNSVSAQDISVFENIAEILPRLPDSENGPAPVATEHFLCGYRYADGPRSLMFSLEELVGIRCCYLEMSREELDIAILSCGMHMSKITSHGRYSEEDAEN